MSTEEEEGGRMEGEGKGRQPYQVKKGDTEEKRRYLDATPYSIHPINEYRGQPRAKHCAGPAVRMPSHNPEHPGN